MTDRTWITHNRFPTLVKSLDQCAFQRRRAHLPSALTKHIATPSCPLFAACYGVQKQKTNKNRTPRSIHQSTLSRFSGLLSIVLFIYRKNEINQGMQNNGGGGKEEKKTKRKHDETLILHVIATPSTSGGHTTQEHPPEHKPRTHPRVSDTVPSALSFFSALHMRSLGKAKNETNTRTNKNHL